MKRVLDVRPLGKVVGAAEQVAGFGRRDAVGEEREEGGESERRIMNHYSTTRECSSVEALLNRSKRILNLHPSHRIQMNQRLQFAICNTIQAPNRMFLSFKMN